jgi:hypothetical protein
LTSSIVCLKIGISFAISLVEVESRPYGKARLYKFIIVISSMAKPESVHLDGTTLEGGGQLPRGAV